MESQTISALPADIIRTIVHIGNDSLADLRQASYTINYMNDFNFIHWLTLEKKIYYNFGNFEFLWISGANNPISDSRGLTFSTARGKRSKNYYAVNILTTAKIYKSSFHLYAPSR